MAGKLDLAGLTDEEAKHVWNVIQRDFNLRKTEEERLGDLKVKIEKEDSKTELLGTQTSLADSHCIRCLQPFKFLVNSKRQCLDCQMFTCKSCSRYNKKEHGWVCDNCRMTRVLKVGTVGWYHDNVRTRFKRFGSAKVMRSLYKRLNGEGGRDDDTQSMPDVRGVYNCHEDDHGEAEAQRYKATRRNKRLLSVHPMDFDAAEDYFTHSRRQSMQTHNQIQEERGYRNDMDYHHTDVLPQRSSRRRSLAGYSAREDHGDSRMVRTRSLSKISSTMARQQYVDTSDEEDYQRYPPTFQQNHYRRRPSTRASSQENLGQALPITELGKRMTAIESLLNRLEEKMTSPSDEAAAPSAAKAEEEKLRRKLSELAGHLSDNKGLSSDEETGGGRRPYSLPRGIPARSGPPANTPTLKDPDLSSSSDELPTDAQKRSTATALCDLTTEVLRTINATENAMVEYGHSEPIVRTHLSVPDVKQAEETYRELEENVYITAGKSFDLESKLRLLEQNTKNRLGGTTDSDLSELEDVLTLTAARVQSTESEVSDIENKIAALSAMDKSKKKMSGSQQRKRYTPDAKNSHDSGSQWKSNNLI